MKNNMLRIVLKRLFCCSLLLTQCLLLAEEPVDKLLLTGNADKAFAMVEADPSLAKKQFRNDTTLLHLSAGLGEIKLTRSLIDKGADINAEDRGGATPLIWAASEGKADILKLLIELKANIETPDNVMMTPLHRAAGRGFVECVNILIKAGAKVNVLDNAKCSPLHGAAFSGSTETVKALVTAGADITAKDRWGATASDVAKKNGFPNVVALLRGQRDSK